MLLLIGAWPASFLVGTVAQLPHILGHPGLVAYASDGRSPCGSRIRLERRDPLREANTLAVSWECASAALPMAAMSLRWGPSPFIVACGAWTESSLVPHAALLTLVRGLA